MNEENQSNPLPSGGEGKGAAATRVRGRQAPTRQVRVLTLRARENRKSPTLAEKKLWSRLRNQRNAVVFRRQQVIGSYIVDFFCSKAKLVVELDGWSHDDTANYDEERTKWLESQGFQVVRIWNMDVIKAADETASGLFLLAERIIEKIPFDRFNIESDCLAPPHPNPLPRRGEGTSL